MDRDKWKGKEQRRRGKRENNIEKRKGSRLGV